MAIDIGTNKMLAGMMAFRNAVVRETVEAVDETCKEISAYAKATHGVQGGKDTHPGKVVFENHTYNLEDCIHHDVPAIKGNIIESSVIATMPYSKSVEMGTSKSPPYPFLMPSVFANSGYLQKELANALQRAKAAIR